MGIGRRGERFPQLQILIHILRLNPQRGMDFYVSRNPFSKLYFRKGKVGLREAEQNKTRKTTGTQDRIVLRTPTFSKIENWAK